jgi:hypothetical protein
MGPMLMLVTAIKLVTEVALLALLGRGALALLAGRGKEHNAFYRILRTVSQPFVVVARWLAPKVVLDRHLPLVAFLVLLLAWLGVTGWKIRLCLEMGVAACR